MPTKYRSVVFLDSPEDFDRWYVEFDESREEGFKYLLQWEYGDEIPEDDSPGWGNLDTIEYFYDGLNKYAVAYNWNLSYVALTQIVEDINL